MHVHIRRSCASAAAHPLCQSPSTRKCSAAAKVAACSRVSAAGSLNVCVFIVCVCTRSCVSARVQAPGSLHLCVRIVCACACALVCVSVSVSVSLSLSLSLSVCVCVCVFVLARSGACRLPAIRLETHARTHVGTHAIKKKTKVRTNSTRLNVPVGTLIGFLCHLSRSLLPL